MIHVFVKQVTRYTYIHVYYTYQPLLYKATNVALWLNINVSNCIYINMYSSIIDNQRYTSLHKESRSIRLKWVQTLEVLEISVEVTRDLFGYLREYSVGHEDTFRLVRAGCSKKIESVSGRGHRHERLNTRYRFLHEYIEVMPSDCRRRVAPAELLQWKAGKARDVVFKSRPHNFHANSFAFMCNSLPQRFITTHVLNFYVVLIVLYIRSVHKTKSSRIFRNLFCCNISTIQAIQLGACGDVWLL